MQEDRVDTSQIQFYLNKMFGRRKGFVAMTYGHNPRTTKPRFAPGDMRQKFYQWPDQYDDLLEDVDTLANAEQSRQDNVEMFICPALRATPSRRKGTAAPLMWVWADLDGEPSPSELERVNALGAMTVLSGTPGHRHVYLPLERPVTARTHSALCRALRAAINKDRQIADDKIAENDLLRLPGTLNWKTLEPRWVWTRSAGRSAKPAVWYAGQLEAMTQTPFEKFLDEATQSTQPTSPDQSTPDVPEDTPAPKLKSLPKPVREAFRNTERKTEGERSQSLYLLVAACKENGVSRVDTHALARTYPPATDKWTWWQISNDVDRIWRKVKPTRKTRDDTTPSTDHTGSDHLDHTSPEQSDHYIPGEDTGEDQPELMFRSWRTILRRVASQPKPRFLFGGIIVEGDYGIISGLDKIGKSFVMGDAAVSLASGTPWMDKFEVDEPRPVIMCVGEGGERKLVRRLSAIAAHKGLSEADNASLPMTFLMGVPSISDEDHMNELEQAVRRIQPGLVIIDPFYLAAAGINLSQINEVGSALAPLQGIVQRHNSALIISHHWNKTGTGDAHSRVSGSGLTAWGRFLISISVESERTEPHTRRTSVTQRWHIKGDEVMTEEFDVEREVWTDDPEDLTSKMHYRLSLLESAETERTKPWRHPPTAEKISSYLEEHPGGAGIRAILKDTRTNQRTAYTVLGELMLHGFVTRDAAPDDKHSRAPYVLVKPFTRDLLDDDNRYYPDGAPSVRPRELDMSAADRPRYRRSRSGR